MSKYNIAFKGLSEGLHEFDFKTDDKFFEHIEGSPVNKGDVVINVILEKRSSSKWLSKAPIPQKFSCPEGYVVTGIDFTHIVHENLTFQESYMVHYAKLKTVLK